MSKITFELDKVNYISVTLKDLMLNKTIRDDDFTIVYKENAESDLGKELLALCEKNIDLKHIIRSYEDRFKEKRTISFKIDSFFKAFNEYSNFENMCKTLRLESFLAREESIDVEVSIVYIKPDGLMKLL